MRYQASKDWRGWALLGVSLVVLVFVLLFVVAAPSISTGIDDRCAESKDNQYACWRAQEAVGPDTIND